ncbi:P-loop containing nucleoside triphosphate hydrolase protein [Bombardia bombarda]|uniref:P-loop containing nucleoside triphosphate hydrolase protein n=1 Tax=Bombardia bombarda TaxID=252184 RepID=A0AA40BW85_9PEZI|nr:P-loop containing nucleoside triphosphate hydrolase protein [Bombardia bombarda]
MEVHTVKILLLGDERCGKSTFLSRISRGRQNLTGTVPITLLKDIDQPFVFDLRSRKGQYRFEFHDTSSPDSWKLLEPDLIIICYDISQRLSLINMQRVWIKEVRTTFASADNLPIMVMGLKRDLRSEDDPNGIIYPQEAYRVSAEMRADKYMECSAVTGELLSETFEDICLTAAQTTTADGGQSEGACAVM